MPFTLSHAAAVLPAIRRNGTARWALLPSALAAGSFAPDVTYFADTVVPGAMEFGAFTHTAVGVVTVNVAIAAALVAVWALLREPLVALLPADVRGRVHAFVRVSGGHGNRSGRPRGRGSRPRRRWARPRTWCGTRSPTTAGGARSRCRY